MLQRRDDGLWTVDDPSFRLMSVAPIGTRMTLVRLRDGRVILISPIRLSAALAEQIRGLGVVAFIVAPNRVHHLFATQAKTAFPEAKLLAAPGLPDKRPRIPFDGLVTDVTSTDWHDELEALPIAGVPFLNEVALFHRHTRTLILTDLCFNIRSGPWWAMLTFRLNDMWQRFGPSRIFRLLIRDREALRKSLDQILRWDFDRVIIAHGEIVENGGRQALRGAYGFLYAS
jgi:Domain of unknown function (DUF4336)